MKLNPRNRTRAEIKPLKVTLTEAEILADLQYPAAIDRSREARRTGEHRIVAR